MTAERRRPAGARERSKGCHRRESVETSRRTGALRSPDPSPNAFSRAAGAPGGRHVGKGEEPGRVTCPEGADGAGAPSGSRGGGGASCWVGRWSVLPLVKVCKGNVYFYYRRNRVSSVSANTPRPSLCILHPGKFFTFIMALESVSREPLSRNTR